MSEKLDCLRIRNLWRFVDPILDVRYTFPLIFLERWKKNKRRRLALRFFNVNKEDEAKGAALPREQSTQQCDLLPLNKEPWWLLCTQLWNVAALPPPFRERPSHYRLYKQEHLTATSTPNRFNASHLSVHSYTDRLLSNGSVVCGMHSIVRSAISRRVGC